jgi:HD-like signal output (HDOD) protein
MSERPSGLAQWVKFLSDEEMPVLAQTARQVAGIANHANTSFADLAQVVLMDGAMTARVLRLANSVYYNPSTKRITTVSRAIVMLGFDTVRSIALSIAMVDTLLRGRQHERVVAEMAGAFHAAVQAKAIATIRGDVSAEEVFIATLLHRLGYMAFWCFPHGCEGPLDEALVRHDKPAAAEREVLGFTLDELTGAINRDWHLSELLAQALEGRDGDNPRVGSLELGAQIAAATNTFGWESAQARQVIARAAEFMYIPVDDATRLAHSSARNAIQAANDYGAGVAARLIPLPRAVPAPGPGQEVAPPVVGEQPGDPEFQLRILRELSAMLAERVDLNALLGMVLEGIYRGIAMDRAVLAIVTPDGKRLKAKYVLGEESEKLAGCFDFAIGAGDRHIIAQVLSGGEAVWLGRVSRLWRQFLTPEVTRCIGETDFFAMPLAIGGRPKGLLYADRRASGRPLDERAFDGFRHFCEQAVIGLSVLGLRGAG